MLRNFTPHKYYTIKEYELVFDDGYNNGYAFPCDANGNLLQSEEENPCAHANMRRCLEHPEKFVRFNKIIKYERSVRDNAHGTCVCGNEVELWDSYLGACQCEKCGRWYNLFGQELLPPENWEEDLYRESW